MNSLCMGIPKAILRAFADETRNRFTMACPRCKQGCNSEDAGGNEKCFHCDVCGLVECVVTSLLNEEDDNG